MRRATVTLPDHLETRVEEFLDAQPGRPSFTSVVEAALESCLGGGGQASSSRVATVLRLRDDIRAAVAQRGAERVGPFGSTARAADGADSDVDLWIDGGPVPTHFDMAALCADAAALLGAPVDLITLSGVPDGARDQVLADSILL